MDDDMAPPNKRRRLSRQTSRSLPSHSDFVSEGPSPTLLHSVEELNHNPLATAIHTVPHHIQEIHFQIQERAAVLNKGYHVIHARQATAVDQIITTINDQGQTITTDITVGATTTDPSPAASGTPDSTGSSNSSSSTSTNLSDKGTATSLGASHNGTATHTSTKDSTGHSDHTTLSSGVFLATLTNGHVVTVTRSKDPYKTTFGDGEVSTICGRNSKCTFETAASTSSSDETSLTGTLSSPTTSTAFAAGGPAQGGTASSSSSATSDVQNNNDNATPPPGTIAGGVVGGAAGLAVIILLAMILLRWYRRRKQLGHHALPPSAVFSPDADTSSSRSPGMAERAGIRPLASAVPGFFKHQNRSDIEPPPSERSFQKVSGRKLPSAYSEGMSSTDFSGPTQSVPSTGVPSTGVPSTAQDRNLSSLSFYRDSHGFYGGEGDAADRSVSPDDVPPMQSDNTGVMLSPGPQRKPTVHTGGPYIMTPSSSVPSTPNMQSPNLATIPGSPTEIPRVMQRSSTPSSLPDNRSSRFTEEV